MNNEITLSDFDINRIAKGVGIIKHTEAVWLANQVKQLRNDDLGGVRIAQDMQAKARTLTALLELALRYISHPDVQAIPFALPASTVQERIEEALAAVKGIS